MKISCLQENLARGLAVVGRAVATRSPLPILSNILLETDQGRLRLAATNLEIGINCWIGARIEEEGSITVPARLLTEFVNSLPPGQIDMELTRRTQTLNLKCARFEANIKGIDPSEFPNVPTADSIGGRPQGALHLKADAFRRMIDQVVFAAATDESRPILTGVLTHFHQGGLTLAAADGFRLSVTTADVGVGVDETISVIVPARALAELNRVGGEQEAPIELIITPTRNQILFHLSDIDLVSQLIDGNFPDYKQIVPKSWHDTDGGQHPGAAQSGQGRLPLCPRRGQHHPLARRSRQRADARLCQRGGHLGRAGRQCQRAGRDRHQRRRDRDRLQCPLHDRRPVGGRHRRGGVGDDHLQQPRCHPAGRRGRLFVRHHADAHHPLALGSTTRSQPSWPTKPAGGFCLGKRV